MGGGEIEQQKSNALKSAAVVPNGGGIEQNDLDFICAADAPDAIYTDDIEFPRDNIPFLPHFEHHRASPSSSLLGLNDAPTHHWHTPCSSPGASTPQTQ